MLLIVCPYLLDEVEDKSDEEYQEGEEVEREEEEEVDELSSSDGGGGHEMVINRAPEVSDQQNEEQGKRNKYNKRK